MPPRNPPPAVAPLPAKSLNEGGGGLAAPRACAAPSHPAGGRGRKQGLSKRWREARSRPRLPHLPPHPRPPRYPTPLLAGRHTHFATAGSQAAPPQVVGGHHPGIPNQAGILFIFYPLGSGKADKKMAAGAGAQPTTLPCCPRQWAGGEREMVSGRAEVGHQLVWARGRWQCALGGTAWGEWRSKRRLERTHMGDHRPAVFIGCGRTPPESLVVTAPPTHRHRPLALPLFPTATFLSPAHTGKFPSETAPAARSGCPPAAGAMT